MINDTLINLLGQHIADSVASARLTHEDSTTASAVVESTEVTYMYTYINILLDTDKTVKTITLLDAQGNALITERVTIETPYAQDNVLYQVRVATVPEDFVGHVG